MSTDAFETLCTPPSQDALQVLLTSRAMPQETPSVKAHRDRQFLPALPERLFCRLAVLPGKALAVYLVLWYRCRVEQRETVTLSPTRLKRYGLTRAQGRHALHVLQTAGLIVVETARPRQTLQITVRGHA
jgi:hypothetical protein